MNIRMKFLGIILIITQISSIRAEVKHKLLLMEIGRHIEENYFTRALEKLQLFKDNNLRDSIQYLVHYVYTDVENMFDRILEFAEFTRDKSINLEIYRALNYEIDLNEPDNLLKTLKLIGSFNKVFGFDPINSNPFLGVDELESNIDEKYKNIASKEFKVAMKTNNETALSELFENIYRYENYYDLFQVAFQRALSEVFTEINTENLINFLESHRLVEYTLYGYLAIFREMEKHKKLTQPLLFTLVRAFKETLDENPWYASARESLTLQDILPSSVNALAFARHKCIANVDYPNEYLFAASSFDENIGSNVYTWTPLSNQVDQLYWNITQDGEVYHITNIQHQVSIYVSEAQQYEFGRGVFAGTPQGNYGNGAFSWVFESEGDNVYIKNSAHHQCLYASSDSPIEGKRKVLLSAPVSKPHNGGLWTIKDCDYINI